jgi:hypothetical protein
VACSGIGHGSKSSDAGTRLSEVSVSGSGLSFPVSDGSTSFFSALYLLQVNRSIIVTKAVPMGVRNADAFRFGRSSHGHLVLGGSLRTAPDGAIIWGLPVESSPQKMAQMVVGFSSIDPAQPSSIGSLRIYYRIGNSSQEGYQDLPLSVLVCKATVQVGCPMAPADPSDTAG